MGPKVSVSTCSSFRSNYGGQHFKTSRHPTFCVPPALLEVLFVAVVAVEPEVSGLVAVDIACVAEPQAVVHIAVVFVVLIPACVLVFEVDIPGRPRSFVLPKISSFANSSSSGEIVHKESVHNSSCVRTSYGCGSKFSNVDLH